MTGGEGNPNFPALLREPSGTGPPTISPTGVGEELSCSHGDWAPDLLGAYLYRAPQSFARQWLKDGVDIPGATGATFTPTEPGDYTCRVTATNPAGSSSQTSSSAGRRPAGRRRRRAHRRRGLRRHPARPARQRHRRRRRRPGRRSPRRPSPPTAPWRSPEAPRAPTPGSPTSPTPTTATTRRQPDRRLHLHPERRLDRDRRGHRHLRRDDSLYWANRVTDTIRTAGLASGIPGAPTSLVGQPGPGFDDPCGVAIDPEDDKIYWANLDLDTIRRANLDGTGAETLAIDPAPASPCGVAIDPAANKIYWSALGTDTIEVANLDGTGAQTLVGAAGNENPAGVVIDPAANKIYWTNNGSVSTIRVANLNDGSNVQTLVGPPAANNPIGVAIDPAANRLYWTDLGTDSVRHANLNDGSNPQTLVGAAGDGPAGLAIDPAANKIYWANFFGGTIGVANLDDGSAAQTPIAGEGGGGGPNFPALLREPTGTGAPTISARRDRDRDGALVQPRRLGARPARSVPLQGAAARSPTSGRRTGLGPSSTPTRISLRPRPATTPAG